MKKMYLSLLLTTTIITVSCMEKEQYYQYNNPQPIIIPEYALTTSYQSNMQQFSQPGYCEANEPGWEFYDDIANMSYNSHPPFAVQPSFIPTLQFVPVYKTTGSTIAQQEKKSLLQTNSLLPDKTIMQELYSKALHIVSGEYTKYKVTQKYRDEQLATLIRDMNNAKNSGIHEDIVGQFAYQIKTGCSVNDICISPIVPIVFSLLKKYSLTVHQTGEQLPLHFIPEKPCLKKINVFSNATNVPNDIAIYPAFFQLSYALRRAVQDLSVEVIEAFIKYLYENNDISQEGYLDGSYKDFKNEFYTNVYNILLQGGSTNDLYSLVQMVDKAKELHEIHNENDLITHADYFSANEPTIAQFFSIFSSSHSSDNVKKRIILFCKLIKKYNRARKGYKITPTIAQHIVYCIKKFLDISLPESTYNSAHLDDTFYAFEEFEQLRNNTGVLIKLTIEQVDEQIKNLKK